MFEFTILDGFFGLNRITDQTYLAIWIPIEDAAIVSGIRWYVLVLKLGDSTSQPNGIQSQLSVNLKAIPNPFNPQTETHFFTQKPGEIQLRIYDLRGFQVVELIGEYLTRKNIWAVLI